MRWLEGFANLLLWKIRWIPKTAANPRWLVVSWKAFCVSLCNFLIFSIWFHMFHFSEVLWSPFIQAQVLCEPSDRFRCTAFGARRKPLASLVTHCPRVGSALQIVLKGTRDAFKTFMSCQNCTLPAGYQTQKWVVSTCINYINHPQTVGLLLLAHIHGQTHRHQNLCSLTADQDLKNFNLLVDSIDDILERADKHLRWCSPWRNSRRSQSPKSEVFLFLFCFVFLISIESMIHYPKWVFNIAMV